MTSDEILQRIAAFGFEKKGSTFSLDGMPMQMYQSKAADFRYANDEPDYSINYDGGSIPNLRVANTIGLARQSFFEYEKTQFSLLKRVRDASGLDFYIPSTDTIESYLSFNHIGSSIYQVSPENALNGWLLRKDGSDYYYVASSTSGGNTYMDWSDTSSYTASKNALICINIDDPYIRRFGKMQFGNIKIYKTFLNSSGNTDPSGTPVLMIE